MSFAAWPRLAPGRSGRLGPRENFGAQLSVRIPTLFCCWEQNGEPNGPSRCFVAGRNKPISPRGRPAYMTDPAA